MSIPLFNNNNVIAEIVIFFLKSKCAYLIIYPQHYSRRAILNHRLQTIPDYLQKHGFASPDELARNLGVSAITIRRDLVKLEQRAMLKRVHGGAVPIRTPLLVPHIAARFRQNTAAKRAIARFAAGLVKRDERIFLDAGSSCYYLAECLPEHLNLTVITHSLDNVNVLKRKTGIRTICLGGEFDEKLNAFVGPLTEMQLSQFFAEKAFIGAAGIDPKYGCVNNTLIERTIKVTMNRQAKEAFILVDCSKFGVTAFHRSVPLAEMKSVITNRGLPVETLRTMQKAGIRVICVPCHRARS